MRLIGVDVVPSRLLLAAELGATHVINVREQDVRERIAHITGGRLRPQGLIGMPNPSVTIPLDPLVLTVGGSLGALLFDFDEINQALADAQERRGHQTRPSHRIGGSRKERVSMATTKTELLAPEAVSGGTAMHWIGGQWLDSGEHRESINPATGEVIGSYAKGGRTEAELAVNAALRAFRETDWKDNRSLRARVLNSMAAGFETRAEHLATEVGKILPHARFETSTVPFNLRFNAALALTEYSKGKNWGGWCFTFRAILPDGKVIVPSATA